jgi:hypothetical protein
MLLILKKKITYLYYLLTQLIIIFDYKQLPCFEKDATNYCIFSLYGCFVWGISSV